MNLKTTIALFILAAGVGVLVWKGADLAPKAGLAPPPMPEAKQKSTDDLADIKAGDIETINVNVPGSSPVYFKAAEAGKPLELPGNWPVRRNEVEELVGTLVGLKSRFQPVPLGLDDKQQVHLQPYGLAPTQDPVVVVVGLKGNKSHTLTFGEGPTVPGENPFTRPAFVRVDQEMAVLRLGPDVLPVLKRPADFYRKRQLFPDASRVKVADSERMRGDATAQFLLGDAVTGITVEGPQGKYVLKRIAPSPQPQAPTAKGGGEAVVVAGRLADAWEIVEPVHDRADPVKLKGILAAIPDLWVEQFLFNPDLAGVFASIVPVGIGETPISSFVRTATGAALAEAAGKEGAFQERAGFKTGATKITLNLQDGSARSLVLGKTTRVNMRAEAPQAPAFPMAPPPPPKIIEEKYYYAKLADNPLVFEVKGEKLSDVLFDAKPDIQPKDPLAKFNPPPEPGRAIDQLRDPNPVRFENEQVVGVTIAKAGKTLELKKTKADPKAESESARKDRWDLVAPFAGLAEPKQVNDLLEALEKLSAKKDQILDLPTLNFFPGGLSKAMLAEAGLGREQATTVTIAFDPATGIPPRTVKIGARDELTKKMFVLGPEPTRLNMVDDGAFTLVNRDARAYRALKLFDLGDDRVDSIVVQGEKAKFKLEENIAATGNTLVLVEPVKADADQEKAKKLLADLGNLEATEYLPDPLPPAVTEAMHAFLGGLGQAVVKLAGGADGLDKPTAVVTLHFAGPKPMAPRTLTVGKARDGKPEYFARLDGSPSVFGIKKEVADALTGGSLALMPLQLWNGAPDGLAKVEIKRGNDAPYSLSQAGGAWKITAPFDTAADIGAINPLVTALSAVRAEKYVAHATTSPAEYGFDMPALRIKFTLTERKVNKPGEEPKEETKERMLIIGQASKMGQFARLEGDNSAVFALPAAAITDLDKPVLELLNKRLLTVAATAVNKIELTGPDGPLTLQKEGNDWKPVGATFPVDVPTVSNVLRILSNLTALKFADFGDTIDWAKYGLDPNSKPATVSVTAGMETHKLEVGKVVEGTPNDRYARVDGGKAVAVLPITVARDLSKGKLDLVERTIFKFDPIDLQAIRRTMNGQEFEATLGGTNWEITKPAKIPADQPGLEELADRLSTLRAERVADVEGKDLAKYGLATPAAVLKLEMLGKGGKPVEKALKIGGPADPMKPDGERFAQADGATTVVVLNANISKRLLAEPVKFRDRSLATFVTADKVVITRDGKDITFTKAGGNWKLTQPVNADAEDEALRELHDALARLRAEEIVVEKAGDLKPYGLDKPERWRVFNGDKEVLSLLVGGREKIGDPGKQKDGFRSYAKLERGDLVVLLDMALTAKLAAEYRKRPLWEPLDVAQATSIEVDTPDGPGSFKLMKSPIGWIDPMNPAERISMETVTDFLDTFAGLKAERFVEHDAKDAKLFGLEPPRKTIVVSTQSGQKRTLFLGRVDEAKRVYARPGDKGTSIVVVLSEADTARVNKDRAGFLVAAKKEEPKKEPEVKKAEPKKKEPKKVDPKKE